VFGPGVTLEGYGHVPRDCTSRQKGKGKRKEAHDKGKGTGSYGKGGYQCKDDVKGYSKGKGKNGNKYKSEGKGKGYLGTCFVCGQRSATKPQIAVRCTT
jgi:hypothetical protein